MAITHRTTLNWVGQGSNGIGGTVEVSSDSEKNVDVDLNASQVDKQVDIAFAFANLKSFFVISTVNAKIETNFGLTPGNTITLTKNIPFFYSSASGGTNPFTVDVTKLFVTNLEAVTGTVQIRILEDVTP